MIGTVDSHITFTFDSLPCKLHISVESKSICLLAQRVCLNGVTKAWLSLTRGPIMFKALSETFKHVSGRDCLALSAFAVAMYAGCKLARWQVTTDATVLENSPLTLVLSCSWSV